jgi:hypothetical protein
MARGLGFTFKPVCVGLAMAGLIKLHPLPGFAAKYIPEFDRVAVFAR